MSTRRALIIGVDAYSFRPLASAVNDAVAMRDELLGQSTRAPIVDAGNVTLLTAPLPDQRAVSSNGPATRDAILSVLRSEWEQTDPAEFLLVYFAGHGLVASKDGRTRETLILPSDVPGPEEGRNMISVTELLSLFAERGPRQQLWIIDACRDMPYQKRPRGYDIDWPEQPLQGQRGQVAIFAVAQGGTALSVEGGQGRFTTHLLAGLQGNGSAVDIKLGVGHCITAQSLHEYSRRRVSEVLEDYDAWTRSVQTPQLIQAGGEIDLLRKVPAPPPRRFDVDVRPPEAIPAVSLALEFQQGLPVATWPPEAAPRSYELRASLLPGSASDGWGPPEPMLSVVDLREKESAVVIVPRLAPGPVAQRGRTRGLPPPPIVQPKPLLPTTGERGIARAQTVEQSVAPPTLGFAPSVSKATLIVRAADPEAHVRLARAEPPWTELVERPNRSLRIDPGVWDAMIVIGDEIIGATRVLLRNGETREVAAPPQITPATASILQRVSSHDRQPAETVMPAVITGDIQGLILPTVLPLLALKLFDRDGVLAEEFAHLDIGLAPAESVGRSPYAVAIAYEGERAPEGLARVRGAEMAWTGPQRRVVLLAGHQRRRPGGTITIEWGHYRTSVAAPEYPDAATIVTARAWPDGRIDTSVSIVPLPVRRAWRRHPDDREMSIGQFARALAVAVPVFRAGRRFNEAGSVLESIARGRRTDPVLTAMAWHMDVASRPTTHDLFLADGRIQSAFDCDPAEQRDALVSLVNLTELDQPVLTASLARLASAATALKQLDHWSIRRFERVVPGQVFNVVHTTGDSDDGES